MNELRKNRQIYIKDSIGESVKMLNDLLSNDYLMNTVNQVAHLCTDCIRANGKIIFAGNGGSAADAQHMAGEFISRFAFDRPGMAALSLATDTSILTAVGNDYGFEYIFSRQIEAIASPNDLFIAYSTSGKSKNILIALEAAKKRGLTTVGLTGNLQTKMQNNCDYLINVPSNITPKIQEGHLVIGHILCGIVEREIFGETS